MRTEVRTIGRTMGRRPFPTFKLLPRIQGSESFAAFSITIGFAILVGLILFFHVWSRLQVIDLGYALAATRTLNQKLEQENHELLIELRTLTSPERLESAARSRLEMRPPKPDEVIILP